MLGGVGGAGSIPAPTRFCVGRDVKLAIIAIVISIVALAISISKIIHDLGSNQDKSETMKAAIEMPIASQTDQ